MPLTKDAQDKTTPNDTPQPVPATVAAPSSKQAKADPAARTAFPWLSVAAVLIALAALAAAGYVQWQDLQQRQQLAAGRAEIAGAVQRADSQDKQLRELQRQLDRQHDESQAARNSLTTDVDALKREIASQRKRLQSLSTTDRGDWLLAEAEYLIRLANQRLLMGRDIDGTYKLLKAADNIMVELDDSGLFPVRKALAEDMAKLRAAGKLDLEGIYLKLGAAASQADKLRLFELPAYKPKVEHSSAPPSWKQRLRQGLAAAWEKLKSYVRFTKRETTYKPLLAPEYEGAVRQNLHLMFEQAQMAALAGNQTLYETSLKKAENWLATYYTLDTHATRALVDTIDELCKQRVEVPLPDISDSLRALKDYTESLHNVKPVPPSNSKTVSGGTAAAGAGQQPAETSP